MPGRTARSKQQPRVEGPARAAGRDGLVGEPPAHGEDQSAAVVETPAVEAVETPAVAVVGTPPVEAVESPAVKAFANTALAKLRPRKIQSALKRRWFEYQLPRTPLFHTEGLIDLGSAYGGWTLPGTLIDSTWTCYMVGAGGDTSVDLELIRRYGATVRSFDAVSEYVEIAREAGGEESHFSAHHAAIATADGPLRMQITHHPGSRSVSAAQLYDTHDFIELPGRTLPSLMSELGDERVDLLKLDIEGSEYEVMPTVDLRAMGVKVFATQLHHTGSVTDARRLIRDLRVAGYHPVACRPTVKLTFGRADLL